MKALIMKKYIFLVYSFFTFFASAQQTSTSKEIDSLNQLGEMFYYTQKDSAYVYFNQVYELSKNNPNKKIVIQTLFNFTGVSSYHHDLKKMGESLKGLEKLIGSYDDHNVPTSNEDVNVLEYYKGMYLFLLANHSESSITFKKIINNIQNVSDSLKTNTLKSLMSGCYSFLGKTYLKQGQYNLAKELYQKNIRTIIETDSNNLEALHGNYNLLAEVYLNENQYQKANNYLLKTLKYNKANKNTNAIVSTSFYLSQNYNKLNNLDSASYYLEEAKLSFNENPVFYTKYHFIKSEIHSSRKEFKSALVELENCLKEIGTRFKQEKNVDISNTIAEMGRIHEILGNNDDALSKYDIALKKLEENFKNQLETIVISKNKAKLLNSTKTNQNYLQTIITLDHAIKILDTLKPTFKNHTDKLFLIENAFPLFEAGIESVYQLHRSTRENSYIDSAFTYAEKSKSVLLLEALLGAKATQFANIPEDILEKEHLLKAEISFIQKELNRVKDQTSELEERLFVLKEEHRQLIKQLETNYKKYYDLKYNTKTISLSDAQLQLAPDEKLISYFYGNEAIYAIGLDKNSKQIERIPIDSSLEEDIKKVHQMLSDPKSDVAALSKITYELYSNLIAPFITSKEKKKLIIISDGLLNYIPFEALNTVSNGLFYLAEYHAVSYTNSATLLYQLQEKKQGKASILAFAPSFKGEQVVHDPKRGNLLPLPHNKREIEQILTSFKGQSFIGENASLKNFTSQISNHRMLHLATHAIFNDESPEYSYLAFTNDTSEEDMLYVSDLYNLQIDADLVTLSACESGIGELKRGEGFLSLARGFFYSGAASIASTLWKVNDASSTTLMDFFYKNLADGDTKDLALQKAKNTFLENNRQNGLSHPYYWSGFIISGNTAPLTTPTHWLSIVFGIVIIGFLGLLVFKRLNKN